jgi:N-acetylglucosaminyldiphosphoundecaprenol N-acetyl-beta-D-mannosaminyltransferase
MSRVMILGVPVDPVTGEEARARIKAMLKGSAQHHVMTPNNEMIVIANRHHIFRELLNRTSLNLPDSTGLLWAARRSGQSLPERVTGVDTVMALCAELDKDSPVFLLGAGPGIAENAGKFLGRANPNLNIVGCHSGTPDASDAPAILMQINAAQPVLLLVAYGAPQQDLWIARYLKEMLSVKVAMGVGGTFDFITGVQKRAPQFMQRAGLEWLWRFAQEPTRWKRMWNAVAVFPYLVLRSNGKSQ